MWIHQARHKPAPGILFHHYTASTIYQRIGKRKKRGGKGNSKASAKHDSCFLYISAKFTSNYFEAKSSKFLVLSQNSEFYMLQKCHSVKKWVFFVLGLLEIIFQFSRHLFRRKKKSLNQVYVHSHCIFIHIVLVLC